MKRLIVILALVMGSFLIGKAQTNQYPVIVFPGVYTPVVEGFDITAIVGTDTMFVASLPPRSSHPWTSDVVMLGATGDTYVSLWARAEDAAGNYYWEPYNTAPGDTLGTADSSFMFEDKISAQKIIGLKITPGTTGTLDWGLFASENVVTIKP